MPNRKAPIEPLDPDLVFNPLRLREAALAAGLTQEQVARRLNLSLRAVQGWYGGTRTPSGAKLVGLALLFGKEPGWFYEPRNTNGEAA